MEKIRIPLSVIALALLLNMQIASAQSWNFGEQRNPENRGATIEQRLIDMGITLPSDWDSMAQEERRTFMQENGFEMGPGGDRGNFDRGQRGQSMEDRLEQQGIELPSDWDTMAQEERRTFMEENGLNVGGIRQRANEYSDSLPENWSEMTQEEQQNYLEENEIDRPGPRVHNYLRNVRKAQNYKKFSGQLQSKKQFSDDYLIRRKDAVSFLQRRGILDGNDDGSFNPQGAINRAESLKVLLEALGENTVASDTTAFSDVPVGAWFTRYVNRARDLGIVKGYEDGSFRPGNVVNQVELLKIAFESFGIDLSDYPVTDLPSGTDLDAWYAVYLQYALDNDLLDEEKVNPSIGMTREEFSEVIYRLIQQQENLE